MSNINVSEVTAFVFVQPELVSENTWIFGFFKTNGHVNEGCLSTYKCYERLPSASTA